MKLRELFVAGAICMAFVGCSKVEVDMISPAPTYKIILSGDIDSKTSLAPESDGYRPVLWKTGDLLGLFVQANGSAMGSAQNIIARLDNGDAGFSKGQFAVSLALTASSTYRLGIYYPYVSDAGTADAIDHHIPAVQTQPAVSDSRHLGNSGHFSYATAEFTTPADITDYTVPTVNFTMDYKTSSILLSVKAGSAELAGWKVKSVKVTAPEGNYLSGDVRYVPSTDALTLTGNQSESLALNVPGGAALSVDAAAELYLVAFPVSLAGKNLTITYTLEAADASSVKTLTHTRAVKSESNAFGAGILHVFNETLPASDAEGWVYSAADAAFDLSANGTANCYIVSAPGKYSFDATVIGNGQKGIMLPTSTTFFHTESATIAPTQASLVWQTAKGLITSVALENGRVVFTKSASVDYGNALIAVKDAEGTILWSWHIWCTDMGALQTYVSDYGTYETMDRNLGATYASSEVVNDDALLLRTVGTYYQWGRKDPFVIPASMGVTIAADGTRSRTSKALATIYDINGATVSRPTRIAASKYIDKSIVTLIQKPDMPSLTGGTTAADWFAISANKAGSGPTARGYSFWGNPTGYNYKSATKPSPVKTIYDPCPVGYMVPPMDWFLGVTPVTRVELAGGVYRTDGGSTTTWIPYASKLHNNYSTFNWLGDTEGNLWYSSFTDSNSIRAASVKLTHQDRNFAEAKAAGVAIQVRCIAEIK